MMNRREFLKSVALAAAGFLVTGFKKAPAEPDEPESFLGYLEGEEDPLDDCVSYRAEPLVLYGHFEDERLQLHGLVRFTDTERNVWTYRLGRALEGILEFNGVRVSRDRQISLVSFTSGRCGVWYPLDACRIELC